MLQAATKPQRPAVQQASQNNIARSSSLLTSRCTAVKAAESDSDEGPSGRSLLTAAAGSASQRSQRQQQVPRAEARPVAAPTAAASSDSDDDLLHAAHAKQAQLLSSKQLGQASNVIADKAAGKSLATLSRHPRQGAPVGTSLPRAIERTTSKSSAPGDKTAPQGLITQISLQRSRLLAGGSLAARQKATAQTKAAAQSDADSDEERWAGLATRAARPRTQVQVSMAFIHIS